MLVDLHSHYPMHIRTADPGARSLRIWSEEGRASLGDRIDGAVIGAASRLWNYRSPTSGPRVTIQSMRAGGVSLALSVLCTPFLEIGNRLTKLYSRKPPYGGPPVEGHLDVLLRQLGTVESRVALHHAGEAVIAHDPRELDKALATGKLALVHCVEGGFSLGATTQSVERAVKVLAGRGVAYITIAHLFWRHFATNVPSVPFVSDATYRRWFPQPDIGLTDLGHAAVQAMVAEGVLIDLTHMSSAALEDTLTLMDQLDPTGSVPLLASHCGFRFGHREYNLTGETVSRVAERDGVIGLMLSPHFMADGLPGGHPASWEDSVQVLCRHIDEIAAITGTHRNLAIGSDLDGFIKPTLAGFDDSQTLSRLGSALEQRYGEAITEAIQSGNALRVLRTGWRGGVATNESGARA
jgi:microsomal dipeptidase-like Zn-dependent dipeptidase